MKLEIEGEVGRIEHSELVYGGGLIMVGGEKHETFAYAKPLTKVGGANTQNMIVIVDDLDAHYERATKVGAVVTRERETHDYGDDYWVQRSYEFRDIGGRHWWFTQRMRTKGKGV